MTIEPPEDSKEALKRPHEIARENERRDHNQSMAQDGGTDGILQNGNRATSAGVSMSFAKNQRIKVEKEKEDAFKRARKLALEAMEARMEEVLRNLEKIDRGLSAIEKLRLLHENGTFDKDNAQHLVLLSDAEITLEEFEGDNTKTVLDDKKEDFNQRKKRFLDKKEDLIREAEENGMTSPLIDKFKKEDAETALTISADKNVTEVLKEAVEIIPTEIYTSDNRKSFFGSFARISAASKIDPEENKTAGMNAPAMGKHFDTARVGTLDPKADPALIPSPTMEG